MGERAEQGRREAGRAAENESEMPARESGKLFRWSGRSLPLARLSRSGNYEVR